MECLYGNTWQDDIRCHRSNLIYRGLPSSCFRLLTKLQRIAGETDEGLTHVRRVEKPLIRNFQRYCASELQTEPSDSIWRWLSIMQYHDAPTRMLDWTSSPFVALHFAVSTEDNIEEDGTIWCINPNELATVDVPQDFTGGEGVRYQLYTADQLDQKINRVMTRKNEEMGTKDPHFVVNTKRDITTILDDLDSFCSSDHPFVVFLDPPADKRITNQATIYSIMASPVAVFDTWLERSPHCCKRVIISAKLKMEIRDKLVQSNVTERVLMPGLEGLSKWLTKYYTPRYAKPTTKLISHALQGVVKTYTPTSWENLLELMFCNDITWDDSLQMHRSKFVFRGLPNATFSLVTSLQRMSKGDMNHARTIEEHIIRNFQRYAHSYNIELGNNVLNWISLAQHHGAPTRLLDWSQSPMVALYFACIYAKEDAKDGVIVCLNPSSCSAYIPPDVRGAKTNFNVFTTDQLEFRIRASDPYMLSALKETNLHAASTRAVTMSDIEKLDKEPFLVFLEPPSVDDKIVNQSGLFSILSTPDGQLDEWILKHPECCRRIIIPAKMKSEIRDKLDHTNINERTLFPGVSGTAQFLSRYYTYRPPLD